MTLTETELEWKRKRVTEIVGWFMESAEGWGIEGRGPRDRYPLTAERLDLLCDYDLRLEKNDVATAFEFIRELVPLAREIATGEAQP